jgi:hypothetical protein
MGSSRKFGEGMGYSKGTMRIFAVCFTILAAFGFALAWHKVFGTWPHLPSH